MPRRTAICLLIVLLVGRTDVVAQDAQPTVALERAIVSAFEAGAYARALELIDAALVRAPGDPMLLYNGACALSRLGRQDDAAARLLAAIEAGFRDIDFLRRDPDLAALRDHEVFTAIVVAAERVRTAAPPRAFDRWRATYGTDAYRYEKDETRRLAYATALDAPSHRTMRAALERQADQLIATLFEAPPETEILVAVPTPTDARRIFGTDDSVGGIYQHDRRRLVARDTGTSLRHEFVHAFHYGHMERLGQAHPIWIQEGLASLYERVEIGADGRAQFLPNERHAIIRRRVAARRALAWSSLFDLDAAAFMDRAGALYPHVRSIFEFIADEGRLTAWYRAYVGGFDADPTGARALEVVFGAEIEAIEARWRRWVLSRDDVDVEVGFGDASLGIELRPRASNDGVLVSRVLPGSAAGRAGCGVGDVIVAVDDRPVATTAELQAIIARHDVGDRVRLRVRRGGAYRSLTVTLEPLGGTRRRR